MKKQFLGIMLLAIIALVTACGVTSTITKSGDASLSDPKGSIAYQLELLKAGDADKLQSCCFTDRIRDRVTKDAVEKGKGNASKYTIDDLVDSVEMGQYEGKKTAKIKMKNGRSLTTLVETNGKWLSDTIWFN
jgi:hypothetical protein